ncbi:putative ribonuclease H protein, partial [Trifolium medium]|nr:putative ribonuclease H protein [Trifolium medium]
GVVGSVALRVYEGLKVARRLNYHFVELHVDSGCCESPHISNGSLRGRYLLEKIRRLVALDWKVVVHHSYREENQCTDALANHGCNMDVGSVFFGVCLSQLFLADVLGRNARVTD